MANVNRLLDHKISPAVLLRLGLAFVFMYAAIAALVNPFEWVGFLPSFTASIIDPQLALKLLAIFQLVLSLWLISGIYQKYAAALSALMLVGILFVNPGQLIITFRDVGLLFAALALFLEPTK